MRLAKVGTLAAAAAIVLSACSGGSTPAPGGSSAPGGSAAAGGGAQPDVCKNKKGSSSTEIHIYSSLPLEGTSPPQSQSIVDELKPLLDGAKVGNFTIKYTSLD